MNVFFVAGHKKTPGLFRNIFPNPGIAEILSGGKVIFVAGRQKCFLWPATKNTFARPAAKNTLAPNVLGASCQEWKLNQFSRGCFLWPATKNTNRPKNTPPPAKEFQGPGEIKINRPNPEVFLFFEGVELGIPGALPSQGYLGAPLGKENETKGVGLRSQN